MQLMLAFVFVVDFFVYFVADFVVDFVGVVSASLFDNGTTERYFTIGSCSLEFGNASSAEVYGFNLSTVASTINYTVTAASYAGNNVYHIIFLVTYYFP